MACIVQIGGLVGRVIVHRNGVVGPEVFQQLRVRQRSVGLRERSADVGEVLVQLVVVDAVIVLQSLVDVVHRFPDDHLVGRNGHDAHDKEDEENDGQNDYLSQTTVIELLEKCFFLVGIPVKLVHNNLML